MKTQLFNFKQRLVAQMNIDQIREDFELLEDWEDRYRYVIELGRKLPDFDEKHRTDENKVRGCASQVWLNTTTISRENDHAKALRFTGDSDAHIVSGLIAILFAIFQDKTPKEILSIDAPAVFDGLGLKDHLTPQRSNGLASMMERIKKDAEKENQG